MDEEAVCIDDSMGYEREVMTESLKEKFSNMEESESQKFGIIHIGI
jgi:hypothetical protein